MSNAQGHTQKPTARQRIGLLGCGTIAGIIAREGIDIVDVTACHDTEANRSSAMGALCGAQDCASAGALLAADFPLLVEAASVQAVRDHLLPALAAGKDVVVLSVGALIDPDFTAAARAAASAAGRRIYIPSGALFGLDNIKVAQISDLHHLLLRTTKHPDALGLTGVTTRKRVFSGSAADAVRQFPKNINVAATLGLAAGIEPRVEIWADPDIRANRHEIEASGAFGAVSVGSENLPAPGNPATSYLAALSVLTLLRTLGDPIRVGT